jgi:hypothetical protein
MPEFPVELTDPNGVVADASLVVRLKKLPKRGSWFDLGNGETAQVKQIRMIGGEPVIFAARDTEAARPRLKSEK